MDKISRREHVISVVTEVAALRTRLAQLEAELDRLLPEDGSAVSATEEHKPGSNGMVPGSIAYRVVTLLNADPSHVFDAAAIAKAIEVANVNSLRGTLQRLTDSKRIAKAGWGKFRACKEPAQRAKLIEKIGAPSSSAIAAQGT